VPNSILEAIQQGQWDFEPAHTAEGEYSPTEALPGSNEKVRILAERLRRGLPLWHSEDRQDYEDLYADSGN